MEKYRAVSREIFETFRREGRRVEGLSLDEAFVELGPRTPAQAKTLTAQIRADVYAATRLTVSAGVATGKMIAKIASDSCKPDGLALVLPGEEAAFLAPMPVARLWGIGPKTQARLELYGIATIGELAVLEEEPLRTLFGSWWREVRDLARGIDERSVEPERETKSISTEETFEHDVRDERRLLEVLRAQAIELAESLERHRIRRADGGREDQARRPLDRGPPDAPGRTDARSAEHLSRRRALPAPRGTSGRAGAAARHAGRLAGRGRSPPDESLRP